MITGISHITFSVRDLEISFSFYTQVLGFKPLAKWPEGAYLLAGSVWVCLSLDSKGRVGPLPEYTHTAFSVYLDDFKRVSDSILASGAQVWKENSSPGESLYFLDPDGHKLEIHASDWQTRLRVAKEEGWEGMEFLV